jgi:O-antigen ligase
MDHWIAPLMLGAAGASVVSIFVFYLLFFLGLLVWVLDCVKRRRIHVNCPPFTIPLLIFLGLVVLSVIFSSDPSRSASYLKELSKLFSVFLIYTYATESQVKRALQLIFFLLGFSAFYGICQYFWLKQVDLLNRIDGCMSHWMTFSGQLMMGAVALACYLVFLSRFRSRPSPVMRALNAGILVVLLIALGLTFTRSAWIGCVFGFLVLLASIRWRWVVLGCLALLALFLLLPSTFQNRFYSSFDLSDTTTRGRIELLRTGIEMITEHPWTGVGPATVQFEALAYRQETELPAYLYQHMHNNLIQVTAEMGIPAALAWLSIWIWILWDFLRMRQRWSTDPFLSYLIVNGICILAAVQVAGLFEYNLGDSEIAILFFFFVTVPYAVEQRKRQDGA